VARNTDNLRPGGTTERYTPQQVADAIRETHGFISQAARRLGCCWDTVKAYVVKYPEVAAAKLEARESMKDIGEAALFKAVSAGEGWAVCFFLKCQAKDRGYIEKAESELMAASLDGKRKWYGDAKTGASELMAELHSADKQSG
jgi:hypothetical protein